MSEALDCDGIQKTYGETIALRESSSSVHAGAMVLRRADADG